LFGQRVRHLLARAKWFGVGFLGRRMVRNTLLD